MPDITIVIPAYKPAELLIKCVESIWNCTSPGKADIFVMCNGSDAETMKFIVQNRDKLKIGWTNEALGFTVAANRGMRQVNTPYILLLNTDTIVEPFKPKDYWIDELIDPLRADEKLAVTGSAPMTYYGRMFLPFFCVGLKKKILEEFNYLDEIFSPGYGEDIDFCFKVTNAGYKIISVSNNTPDHVNKINISDYPVFHKGQGSFGESAIKHNEQGLKIIFDRYIK